MNRELVRLSLQCMSLVSFLGLFVSLSYPLGPEGSLLQWFSRLDPWFLFSHLRWQHDWPSWGWAPLVTVLITLFGGRVFCGWLCPFGALLMLTDKMGRMVYKGGMLRLRADALRAIRPIRYYWLLLIVIVFALGSNLVLFLTPFALFSHEIMKILQGTVPWALVVIIGGTVFFSRVWCSVICPTGLCLSLASRLRMARYRISGDCIHCGQCTQDCPVGAAPLDSGVANEACLVCGTCRNNCPTNAISWRRILGEPKKAQPGVGGMPARPFSSRRQFFKVAGTVALAAAFWQKAVWAAGKVLRPPGALPEEEFKAICNRCGRCIQVCPSKALWPMPVTDGLANFETPQIIPRKNRCDLCMVCQEVCPTGAIGQVPLDEVHIGQAHIDRKRCLAWNEQKLCFLCGEQCPLQAIIGDAHHRPIVSTDKCVGCGACENGCPIEGEAAIRVLPRES